MSENESNTSRRAAATTDTIGRAPRLRGHLWDDLRHGATAALLGCVAFALVDYAATVWTAPPGVAVATALRLFFLELTLAGLLYLVAAPLLVGATAGVRLLLAGLAPRRAESWPGFFAATPAHAGPGSAAPWLWSLAFAGAAYLGASTLLTLKLGAMFKEPQLTALVLAFAQLVLVAVLALAALLLARGLGRLGRMLAPRTGRMNPFGSAPAALLAMVVVAVPVVHLVLRALPQLGPLVPWRHLVAAGAFAFGAWAARPLYTRFGRLWPRAQKPRLIAVGATLFAIAILAPVTLVKLGADPDTKALAVSSSPPMNSLIDAVRKANDFDDDGFGSLLGETDCAPFDPKRNPLARDLPDNGIDENCDGRDFVLGKLPTYRTGERMPVPDAYDGPWNIVLITVDTVRYDHTSFGGYIETSGRDTTPRLAEFVKRSVSFSFANAPSAGTMASIPAILTSKFFHSGIALDEDVPRGAPPRLTPENTLISEVVKEKGYTTGAITTHYYFNDWGMEQGFDTYDNSIGKENQPYAITSDKLTDRAIAWMGKHGAKSDRWMLWLHYLDPHGRYVAHPGGVSYGSEEKDLYDGELHYTDQELGRLLDYISRSPDADRTVVFITSDHGDAFGEHGYINHGSDLHREILHVPLIVYVPNIVPRVVDGPVSPIDIFPTIADLVGADISALGVEGESLVPQLFYGKDATERIVFAETNYRNFVRAVVSDEYKLIRDLKTNVHRLYDLKKDPLEKKNVASKQPEALGKMNAYLDEWLERVFFARDPESNQVMAKLRDHLVREPPAAMRKTEGVSFDDERIEVLGLETDKERYAQGDDVKIAVYFRASEQPSADFKLQVEAWPEGEPNARPQARSKLRVTAKGLFSSSHWRPGEVVRDRFKIRVPRAWFRDGERSLRIGLRMTGRDGEELMPTGKRRDDKDGVAVIGEVTLEAAPAVETTPAKTGTAPGKAGARTPSKSRPTGKPLAPTRMAPPGKSRAGKSNILSGSR